MCSYIYIWVWFHQSPAKIIILLVSKNNKLRGIVKGFPKKNKMFLKNIFYLKHLSEKMNLSYRKRKAFKT